MTPEQFVYWLQGFAEMTDDTPTEEQWQVVRDHLSEVFDKRTPARMPSFEVPVIWPTTPTIDPPAPMWPSVPFQPTAVPLPEWPIRITC